MEQQQKDPAITYIWGLMCNEVNIQEIYDMVNDHVIVRILIITLQDRLKNDFNTFEATKSLCPKYYSKYLDKLDA